jgi:hypothetical protein
MPFIQENVIDYINKLKENDSEFKRIYEDFEKDYENKKNKNTIENNIKIFYN